MHILIFANTCIYSTLQLLHKSIAICRGEKPEVHIVHPFFGSEIFPTADPSEPADLILSVWNTFLVIVALG